MSGAGLGEPRTYRFDCDEPVEVGDWLVEKSPRTECGERWYTVLAARPVNTRGRVPRRRHRLALTLQERQTPTSEDPSIPEDFPATRGEVHFFEREPRRPAQPRRRA